MVNAEKFDEWHERPPWLARFPLPQIFTLVLILCFTFTLTATPSAHLLPASRTFPHPSRSPVKTGHYTSPREDSVEQGNARGSSLTPIRTTLQRVAIHLYLPLYLLILHPVTFFLTPEVTPSGFCVRDCSTRTLRWLVGGRCCLTYQARLFSGKTDSTSSVSAFCTNELCDHLGCTDEHTHPHVIRGKHRPTLSNLNLYLNYLVLLSVFPCPHLDAGDSEMGVRRPSLTSLPRAPDIPIRSTVMLD